MKRIAIGFYVALSVACPARAQNGAPCTPHVGPPIVRPIAATHTQPPYPRLSQQLEEAGITTLKVAIGTDGSPTDVTIDKSSGSLRLDSAAASYIKASWKWQPPQGGDCSPVGAITRVAVNWHLNEPDEPGTVQYTRLDMALSDYPAGAVDRKEQGLVGLIVTVPADGSAPKVAVNRPSGFPDLDDQTLNIVRTRYRWRVGEMNGKPVVTMFGVLAVWTLPLPAKQ